MSENLPPVVDDVAVPAAEPIKKPLPKQFGAKPKATSTTSPDAGGTPRAPAAPVSYAFRFYRCMNCDDNKGDPGTEFSLESTAPVICPSCGIRGNDPQVGQMIVPLVMVHWEPPHPVLKRRGGGIGAGHIACNSRVAAGGEVRVSGELKAVNCPACKHAAANQGLAEGGFDPKHDFVIEAPPIQEE